LVKKTSNVNVIFLSLHR